MIGIIVSGHGGFASGITRGVELVAGKQEQYEAVDFTEQDSIDELENKLREAADRLRGCRGILILTDLTGGSPFNVSCRLKMEALPEAEVIGGANVPAVLGACMERDGQEDVHQLASDVLSAGCEAMSRFEISVDEEEDYED